MVDDTLYELNKAISAKMILPPGDVVISKSIAQVLEGPSETKGGAVDSFQNHLQKAGYSGTLIKVASDINASRVDSFIRNALSHQGIFFYLAYRTIVGNEITDTSGIATNMMESIGLVQSYVNTVLVDKVIASENLNATTGQIEKIKRYFENREIDYSPGKPSFIIEEFFVSLVEGGSLIGLVRSFVNSDRVKLPRDVNKDDLIQRMVDYLIGIGYVHQVEGTNDSPSEKSGPPMDTGDTGTTQTDNLEAIEGIGPATQKRMVTAGIRRYAHLAELSNEELKQKLGDKGIKSYSEIIEQAQLIASGKFEQLVALQKKLNKK